VVICLERGADLHMSQLMPLHSLSLASVKYRLGFYSAMLCIRGTSHVPVSVSVCHKPVFY